MPRVPDQVVRHHYDLVKKTRRKSKARIKADDENLFLPQLLHYYAVLFLTDLTIMAALIAPGVALLEIFGPELAKGVGHVVQTFEFRETNESTRKDTLHVNLAPSFGALNRETVQKIDDDLKIMIAATLRELLKISPEQRTWEKVVSVLMQDNLIEQFDKPIDRTEHLSKEGTHWFKIDGSPDPAIVDEVVAWFDKLISDPEVLKSTTIDIKVMARIVAQTGATIRSLPDLVHENERHEKTMVDIGVLEFPSTERPYLQVYRIQLDAFSSSDRTLGRQHDHNGITGRYNSRKFKPRPVFIHSLAPDVKVKAIKEANELFA
ncbi:hypothetical protein FA95DRAFT_1565114 [Auriscalpium vulgare]|uniref:Uncharacterized protein n=1 Tax=Auriscalpium vulgare TaxID=40419 RepID=A0ACB8RDJ3_9AGAM|nr:hypothetical protein FA95DRAFT_1565114 [Auriscalpium vulgare]